MFWGIECSLWGMNASPVVESPSRRPKKKECIYQNFKIFYSCTYNIWTFGHKKTGSGSGIRMRINKKALIRIRIQWSAETLLLLPLVATVLYFAGCGFEYPTCCAACCRQERWPCCDGRVARRQFPSALRYPTQRWNYQSCLHRKKNSNKSSGSIKLKYNKNRTSGSLKLKYNKKHKFIMLTVCHWLRWWPNFYWFSLASE